MYFTRRTMQPGHYRFFIIPPKIPYSNQATQKNTCQIFVPKKTPESKISNPKKSFEHPRHLKSRVPPPGDTHGKVKNNKLLYTTSHKKTVLVFISTKRNVHTESNWIMYVMYKCVKIIACCSHLVSILTRFTQSA